jgi:hypothetical protein
VASRRLLHVVTDPNTPGCSVPKDADANEVEKVSWVVPVNVLVTKARDDSTHPNDTSLSYTMYASVSASGITKYAATSES